jgi:hypothetical protein
VISDEIDRFTPFLALDGRGQKGRVISRFTPFLALDGRGSRRG